MTKPIANPLDELIEQITTWPVGMPVRLMERVMAMGETAVPDLAEALTRWQDDEERRSLIRERIGRDLIWRWERFPGFNWSVQ